MIFHAGGWSHFHRCRGMASRHAFFVSLGLWGESNRKSGELGGMKSRRMGSAKVCSFAHFCRVAEPEIHISSDVWCSDRTRQITFRTYPGEQLSPLRDALLVSGSFAVAGPSGTAAGYAGPCRHLTSTYYDSCSALLVRQAESRRIFISPLFIKEIKIKVHLQASFSSI